MFVTVDKLTRRESGFLSVKGFSAALPPKSDWFRTFAAGERHYFADLFRSWRLGFPHSQREYTMTVDKSSIDELLVEAGGRRAYAIDLFRRVVHLVHDGEPAWGANLARATKPGEPAQVVLRTSDSLRIVDVTNEGVAGTEVIPIPERLRRAAAMEWVRGADGDVLVTLLNNGWRLTWLDSKHQPARERDVANPHFRVSHPEVWQLAGILLAVQTPAAGDILAWVTTRDDTSILDRRRARELGLEWPETREMQLSMFAIPLPLMHLSAVIWSVLAVRRLRLWNGSARERGFWTVWTLMFGLPGYLAFRVHRTWPECARRDFECRPPSPKADLQVNDQAKTTRSRRERATLAGLIAAYERCLDVGEQFGARMASHFGWPAGHTALLLREWRLTAGLSLLSCLAYALVLARLMGLKGFGWLSEFVGEDGTTVPFVADRFAEPFLAVGIVLAVGLAVWQTATESRGEAWLFLLHRPVSRRAVLVSKLATGLLVLMSCTALPIVAYAAWLSRPGSYPAPFEWSMTETAWRHWAALTPVYLGTLLTMLRPARWWGTRLLPVIAALGWLMGRYALGFWWSAARWEFLVVVVIDVVLVSCLLLVIREREYP